MVLVAFGVAFAFSTLVGFFVLRNAQLVSDALSNAGVYRDVKPEHRLLVTQAVGVGAVIVGGAALLMLALG